MLLLFVVVVVVVIVVYVYFHLLAQLYAINIYIYTTTKKINWLAENVLIFKLAFIY
jgi:hypothetical protein